MPRERVYESEFSARHPVSNQFTVRQRDGDTAFVDPHGEHVTGEVVRSGENLVIASLHS